MEIFLNLIVIFTGILAAISALVGVSSLLTVSRFRYNARLWRRTHEKMPTDTPSEVKKKILMEYNYNLKPSGNFENNISVAGSASISASNISINSIPRKIIDAKARSIVPGPDREEVSNETDNAQQMDQ